VALAAHQIAVSVESLSFMPGLGMSVAGTTLVGQSLGAGKPDLAQKSVRRVVAFGVAVEAGMVAVAAATRGVGEAVLPTPLFGSRVAVDPQAPVWRTSAAMIAKTRRGYRFTQASQR
jgi:hypothetical protein